jgi:hypothetical protein
MTPLLLLAALLDGLPGILTGQSIVAVTMTVGSRVERCSVSGYRPVVALPAANLLAIQAATQRPSPIELAHDRLEYPRDGARAVLRGLAREDQAALVTFSDAVVRGSDLTSNIEQVHAALNRAGGRGDTALIDAAFTGMILGESDVGRALLIVFSDGLDTASFLPADVMLDTAKHTDVVIYAVVAGGSSKIPFLHDLTEATGGTFYDAGSM